MLLEIKSFKEEKKTKIALTLGYPNFFATT